MYMEHNVLQVVGPKFTEWPREPLELHKFTYDVFELLWRPDQEDILQIFLKEAVARGFDVDRPVTPNGWTLCWRTPSAAVRDCLIDLGANPNLYPRWQNCGAGCVQRHMYWYYAVKNPSECGTLVRHIASGRLELPLACPCLSGMEDSDVVRKARELRAGFEDAVLRHLAAHFGRDVASLAWGYLFAAGCVRTKTPPAGAG